MESSSWDPACRTCARTAGCRPARCSDPHHVCPCSSRLKFAYGCGFGDEPLFTGIFHGMESMDLKHSNWQLTSIKASRRGSSELRSKPRIVIRVTSWWRACLHGATCSLHQVGRFRRTPNCAGFTAVFPLPVTRQPRQTRRTSRRWTPKHARWIVRGRCGLSAAFPWWISLVLRLFRPVFQSIDWPVPLWKRHDNIGPKQRFIFAQSQNSTMNCFDSLIPFGYLPLLLLPDCLQFVVGVDFSLVELIFQPR